MLHKVGVYLLQHLFPLGQFCIVVYRSVQNNMLKSINKDLLLER